MAQEKGLAFDVESPDHPVTIRSDRRSLNQILINLTGNAIKFTDAGGIRLRLRISGEDAEFTVSDTGRGIKAEDRSKLFQAFSQVDASSTKPREGTGLGLHLSQRLAALLGGRI